MPIGNKKWVREGRLRLADVFKRTESVNQFHQLMQTHDWRLADLRDLQMRRLRNILRHCKEQVPFYREVFLRYGVNPEKITAFTNLEPLPILTKDMVRHQHKRLVADNAKRFIPRWRATSGSTGEPLRYYGDRLSHSLVWGKMWRALAVYGAEPGETILTVAGTALTAKAGDIKRRLYFKLMGMTAFASSPLSEMRVHDFARRLRQKRCPRILFGYPSAIAYLAGRLAQMGFDRQPFKVVVVTSEVLLPNQRKIISRTFNCPVYDLYANNESNLFACECRNQDGLHQTLEDAFLEVVDDAGRPVPAGQPGRIIATNLVNYAMPFIRYDTGDLGQMAIAPCGCGDPSPRIQKIMGRSRDFLVAADGTRYHGSQINAVMLGVGDSRITGWFIRQESSRAVTVYLRAAHEPAPAIRQTLIEKLDHALEGRFVFTVRVADELPTGRSGKLKVVESYCDCSGVQELGVKIAV